VLHLNECLFLFISLSTQSGNFGCTLVLSKTLKRGVFSLVTGHRVLRDNESAGKSIHVHRGVVLSGKHIRLYGFVVTVVLYT